MRSCILAFCAALAVPTPVTAQTQGIQHGVRPQRLVIRNATVVDGNGTPARGPFDIVIEGNRIVELMQLDPVALRRGGARRPDGDVQIDATGKYVLPGLINAHAHLQSNRSGRSLGGYDYVLKLWLANGITSVREVGPESDTGIVRLRNESAAGTIVAPRLFAYPMLNQRPTPRNAAEARARIRHFKEIGADGVKFTGVERDVMEAALDEAHKLSLRVAHHVGVEETNAWDDIAFGATSIEHWYGIPDAAILDLRQHFPSDYNYLNETDRFRWAGRLWREADPARLDSVLTAMVRANVAWVPTMDIYEASRDLQRAQNQPWFKDYLHPSLEWYFRPDPANHGSYFIGWSTTDEVYWKENYRIWMAALREFERKGGVIGCGDDAGFIYQMYGYGLIREMELHAEAGFLPLKIIEHCTGNGAKILGQETQLGRLRAGWLADVIVVDGNPLEDLKVLYAGGTTALRDGEAVQTNGVEWVIKDGIPYSGPQLLGEVKAIVDAARAGQ
ncbi:MAG: amidohydrolase family protein [Gemmatimonadota bacterium]|nr:amidohydrolase family protein [Gemmatimonadota bacterium]MDH5197585.1 amidohydrolase family protein [Gemmatimonadota bacterium]